MTIKVTPLSGDNPGWCHMVRGGVPCTNEAAVTADVPIPGLDGVTIPVKWCRQDWAEVVEKEELDLRKTVHGQPDANGNMTLGAYPPMRDND